MKDIKKEIVDIIVVAGQSNAEGNGISLGKEPLIIDCAFEAIDANPHDIDLDENGGYLGLKMTMPPKIKVQSLQERKTGDSYCSDLTLSFAEEYLKNVKTNRKLLFVKAAFGGTGFAKKQQGVGNPLYERLVLMTKEALNLNKGNKIIGLLWHQGEHDAFENENLNDQERYDFYYHNLKEQFEAFRNEFKEFNIPIITGGFCDEWKKTYLHQCLAVEQATKDVCAYVCNATFVDLSGLSSNNQEIGNGDGIHFSKKSMKIVGERYFEAFKKLI